MAPASRGKPTRARKAYKVVKPKSGRKQTTQTTKNHRFQSFNARIADLKIDPIRRKRHVDVQETAGEETHTHFGQSLEEWRDSNLSRTFTAFAKDVAPLCDNLPVVLFNEDKIMHLLATYIEKADSLAMEPLLALLSHFAHDLDTRFEKHFRRAVATVTAVAAKHPDLAVVEWSFNSLAWLFKYLSRLLIPDLRPLYDLMAPYLGKEPQRAFIVRFSAEALSFLFRKAAVTNMRDETPLDTIMEHIMMDCMATVETATTDLHHQGIMTMLTEAIKGVQNSLNTSAVPVLKSLLSVAGKLAEENDAIATLVGGVLTSMVHHCTAETFKPIQDTVTAYILDSGMPSHSKHISFCCSLLFTIISVRKGTRIAEWKTIMEAVQRLYNTVEHLENILDSTISSFLGLLAVSMQMAPIGAALTVAHSLKRFGNDRWKPYFLNFCDLFTRLGTDRFKDILSTQFHAHAMRQPVGGSEALFSVIPRIADCRSSLHVNPELLDVMFDDLARLNAGSSHTTAHLAELDTNLTAIPYVSLGEKQSIRLRGSLAQLVRQVLAAEREFDETTLSFALGTCFHHVLRLSSDVSDLADLWPLLCSFSSQMVDLAEFWTNLLQYVRLVQPTNSPAGEHIDVLQASLIACLSMPSHDLREDALSILQELYKLKNSGSPSALATMITIESTPISLETSRSISMNTRRLAQEYGAQDQDMTLSKAIPSFCFGLLHLNLAQAWDDAINSLAAISQSKEGEEAVMGLVQSWLDGKPKKDDDRDVPVMLDMDSDGFKVLSDFECPNLAKNSAICKQVLEEPRSGALSPAEQFAVAHKRVPHFTTSTRFQALKLLNRVPRLAEKRSRLLVPILLKWTGLDNDEVTPTEERWERKDQKAMLAIFAQFVNPKVLYKSDEVCEALLSLCANGDVEIQRSALKAVLSWKDPVHARYEEHLNNLLDEARFREEISVFLRDRTEEEEEGILPEHHAQLMPVLLRLIYGRAVAGGKDGQAGRRKAIFIALSRFGEEVLRQFLRIALLRSRRDGDTDVSVRLTSATTLPLRQQLGVLNMINDMIQVLGAELETFVAMLMSEILYSTISASRKLEDSEQGADLSLLRDIRQTGMQCLVKVFSHMSEFKPEPYRKVILNDLIEPRLETFANENTQSVSASLRLFAAWSTRGATAYLFTNEGSDVLGRIAGLLRNPHTKPSVQLFILQDIVDSLTNDNIDKDVLQPHVSSIVKAIGVVVKQQPSKEVLDACVKSFSQIADRISSGDESAEVTEICNNLLVKPSKSVTAATKTSLLRTLLPLIERFEVEAKGDLYRALCALFSRLHGAESRQLLSQVTARLVRDDGDLLESAKVCGDMNAMGTHLDEPDHERREQAFAWVYAHYKTMLLEQWLPIVHNCLFYIRDGADRVNRSSAAHALQLFVDAASASDAQDSWLSLLHSTVLFGIEKGMKEPSELVRAEHLAVLGHIIKTFPVWPRVSNMQTLVMSGDDEASFFSNILHIQQHRRLRALKRLADESAKLGSDDVSSLLLPLLEHFVFDQAEGDSGRTLADQTVQTIGVVSKALNRQAFRTAFQRYASYLKSKSDLEKLILRLLGVLVDGIESSDPRVTPAIINEQLPPLLEYLHLKDESTVDRRMPVAVTIVKLMLALPEADFALRFPAVLTDVSHVLRSRSQEARDQTRKALNAISKLVGAQYFRFILRELRSALKRGYQLHVLSYTVHSLLVDASFEAGDLDECLPELMIVVMDDIFGTTGQEKDAEEYNSGMKEVKSSKSFDTLELLASITPVNKLGELIRPIQALLSEKLDIKVVKKLDELLTRLRKGLDHNPASESRDMLSFCWEMVCQVHAESSAAAGAAVAKTDERINRYIVQPEVPRGLHMKGATTSYSFKLVSFALNLLRKVVRRHEDLQTPQNMAGFLPMAGDALLQGQEEVKLSALRLLSTIMRVALPQLEADAMLYVKEAVALVKGAPNLTTDAVKAALELVTSVLREKRSVDVKEKDIALLLKRIKVDLDEPDRQGIIFRFLRAVLGRKIIITEVYELMDDVGKAMVTNPDASVRESARSTYLQFVMEYPQGKDRWQKQTAFLVGNLQYEHASGRRSVMEFLHQMLGKVGDNVIAETSSRILVSLLLVLVSDSDNNCREMAKLLVGKLFERADDAQMKNFLSMMEVWLGKGKKASVKTGALRCWSILMQTTELAQPLLEGLRDKLEEILREQDEGSKPEPQLILDALETFSTLIEAAPGIGFREDSADLWETLQTLPTSDNPEMQALIAALLGLLFDNFAAASSKATDGLAGLPLRGSGGLELGFEDMRRLCTVNVDAIRQASLNTSSDLMQHIIHNLRFLGRCFDANGVPWDDRAADGASEDEETLNSDQSAFAHLLRQLSHTIATDKYSVIARSAALQCEASLLNQLTNPIPNIQTVLRPLYALTDPSVPKPPGELHKALQDKAHETLDLIQKKLGSEAYVAALGETRRSAKKVRDERRQKRKVGAVAQPDKWEKRKKKKHEVKKEKIKERGKEAQGKRRGW